MPVLFLQRSRTISGMLSARFLFYLFGSSNFNRKTVVLQCCTLHHLTGRVDKFNGMHVSTFPRGIDEQQFKLLLGGELKEWKGIHSSVWLHLHIKLSKFLRPAYELGFKFHHAEGVNATLCQWLGDGESLLPSFASHQVGVAGAVIDESTQEILTVRAKGQKHQMWKFPGGLANLGEDIGDVARREVLEETGIRSEFQSILTFRQAHDVPGAFGRSDLFFLCRMKPLNREIRMCQVELEECRWINMDDLSALNGSTSAVMQRAIQLIQLGQEKGFQEVDVVKSEELKSIFKGKTYFLYHRCLAGGELREDNYLKDICSIEG